MDRTLLSIARKVNILPQAQKWPVHILSLLIAWNIAVFQIYRALYGDIVDFKVFMDNTLLSVLRKVHCAPSAAFVHAVI